MSNKKETTQLTVVNDVATVSVPQLIEEVDDKIGKFKHLQDSVYKTKKNFDVFNIETETNISVLIAAYSAVQAREEAFTKAGHELIQKGIIKQFPSFKLEGSGAEDWYSDISLKIQLVEQKETLDELNGIKKELSELLDKDDRKTILFNKLAAFGR